MNPKECPVCQAPNNGSFDSVFGSFLLVPDDTDSIPDSVLHLFQGMIDPFLISMSSVQLILLMQIRMKWRKNGLLLLSLD